MLGNGELWRLTDMDQSDNATRKAYRRGTHRAVAPAETLAHVRPLMAEMGITRVANVTGLDRIGLPVVMAVRPNSRSISVSQGKGLDLDEAKASGVMEAVETYHAERVTLPLKLGSLEDLGPSHPMVDVDRIPKIATSQFRPSLPILWIEGCDLINGSPVWLPYELVHANYTLPFPTGSGCFMASTNGLASGNHRLEAIGHGICEVLERDATTLWRQKNKVVTKATGLDLDTVDDATCCEVLERFADVGVDVTVWETTSDVEIACFYCMIVDRVDQSSYTADGAGCHLVREVALLRALTEAAQVRTTYIVGSREDLPSGEYAQSARRRKRQAGRSLMHWHAPARSFQSVPNVETETFEEDLHEMLRRLQSAGIEQVGVVDLTKTEFQLPVVRVVIPGLEGPDEHPGYVRGARAKALQEAPV